MFKRLLGFLLLMAIAGILGFNFKHLLSFGQAHEIRQQARRAIAAENWEKAARIYASGLKQYPNNAALALRLGWIYRKAGQPDRAEAVYMQVLKKEPAHVETLLALAALLSDNPHRLNEAVNAYRRALKAAPDDPAVVARVGDFYKDLATGPGEERRQLKQWLNEQAQYYYLASLKRQPRQLKTQFNLGVTSQNLGDLQGAAKAYCQVVLLNLDSYEARYNLGVTLSELDYLDEGYRQMERALKILSEKDRMAQAQTLALRVQNVKNQVYHSGKKGLSRQPDPPFLDKGCLYKPALPEAAPPASPSESAAE